MTRYHISPDSGRPNICRAQTPDGCLFKAADGTVPQHYATKEEARIGAESTLSNEHGAVKTLHKTPKSLFTDIDPQTAEPVTFDKKLAQTLDKLHDAEYKLQFTNASIQKAYNKQYFDRVSRKRKWIAPISQVLAETLNDPNPDVSKAILVKEYNERANEVRESQNKVDELDKVFKKRGGWNRAFLVPDGHLHKGMDCSTCNKGGASTKFSFMTDYSNSSEKQIVDAAGYRACTTCYPSAPIGDENTLPTKMFTKEEEEKQAFKQAQAEKKVQKAADANAKAPTASGEPLKIREGSASFNETFKTERSALTWYADRVKYPINHASDQEKAMDKQARYTVLFNIAEKRDISIKELQNELHEKAVKTKEKDYKEVQKRFAHQPEMVAPYTPPLKDVYDVPDELLNKSPREWDDSKYIPFKY